MANSKDTGPDRQLTVRVLASGSSGNATYVGASGVNLLIDCGVALKRLREGLTPLGLQLEDLNGVVLTHEHSDHIRNLPSLLRQVPGCPVYATRGTARAARRRLRIDLPGVELSYNQCCAVGALRLIPFATSHDAAEPMGLRVQCGDLVMAMATDLGEVTPEVSAALQGASLLIVEANHDRHMLLNGPYPPVLKRRVSSATGHLSNEQTRELLEAVQHPGLRTVVLAHLSADNNRPQLAKVEIEPALLPTVQLEVATRHAPGEVHTLS